MSKALNDAYAEIHYHNQDSYAGSGFLIDGQHLVTCTHVLTDAFGDISLHEGLEVRVDLRYQNYTNIIMELVCSYPRADGNITSNQLEDMALLKFKEGTTPSGIPYPTIKFPDLYKQDGDEISIYSHKQNNYVDAKNKSHSPEGWLILDTNIAVQNGDSGSPVWNKKIQAITGMLVARQRTNLTCYAIPTVKIREAFKKYLTKTEVELTVPKENNKRLLPKRPDSLFLSEIKRNIAMQLNAPGVVGLKNVLSHELDQILQRKGMPLIADNSGDSIAQGLILGLTEGGDPPPVINEAIMSAAINCLDKDKIGGAFQSYHGQHAEIKQAIEQILGWLVIASVVEKHVQNISDVSGLFFELPVVTLGGVEVIASRCFQRQAKLRQEGTRLIPNHVLDVSAHISLSAWSTKPIVDLLRVLLWNQVFPDRTKGEGELVFNDDLEELNAELANRHAVKEEKYKEHHIMAFKANTLPAEELQLDVYRQLYEGLNNLTLIRFGSKKDAVFCVPEFTLISAVRAVLNHINNLPLP